MGTVSVTIRLVGALEIDQGTPEGSSCRVGVRGRAFVPASALSVLFPARRRADCPAVPPGYPGGRCQCPLVPNFAGRPGVSAHGVDDRPV